MSPFKTDFVHVIALTVRVVAHMVRFVVGIVPPVAHLVWVVVGIAPSAAHLVWVVVAIIMVGNSEVIAATANYQDVSMDIHLEY